jgi:hypothetical protein
MCTFNFTNNELNYHIYKLISLSALPVPAQHRTVKQRNRIQNFQVVLHPGFEDIGWQIGRAVPTGGSMGLTSSSCNSTK